MHVTRYHQPKFPPVKQMSRYWSVHTTVQEGLLLNFLQLSINSEAALMSGLYHTSERGLCCCHEVYQEAWLLQIRHKILGISLTNFMESSAYWEGHTGHLEDHHCSYLFWELFTSPHRSLWCNICMGEFCYFRKLLAVVQFSKEIWLSLHQALTALLHWIHI